MDNEMMGPGFMSGLAEGLITLGIIAAIVALLLGFGIGWLVFG